MQASELVIELDLVDEDATVFVDVNGVIHEVHSIVEDSQGVYLSVDLDQEERDMR